MAQVESMEVHNLEYQKVEEDFEDRDVDVFDTLLLNGPIGYVKEKLRLIKEQRTNVHNIYQSYFHFFPTSKPGVSQNLLVGVLIIILFPRE